ncbi:hypothetical protein [Oryzobacter terrae]|uniref:hypothetical protein n=1 Tax=Oryzobacter terrae TaxID=1620385 RepID=UPI00366B8C83
MVTTLMKEETVTHEVAPVVAPTPAGNLDNRGAGVEPIERHRRRRLGGALVAEVGRGPLTFHAVSLALVSSFLLWSARGLHFYYDDWPLVAAVTRGDASISWLFAPHNEHLILVPKLVYAGLYAVVGAGSALPYLAVTIGLHLMVCHLLWRLSIRGGADPWHSTLAVAGFATYAAGVENILFVVTLGLLAAVALGIATLLEVSRPRPRGWLVVVMTTGSFLAFGIAPLLLALIGLLIVVQRRFRRLLLLLPSAVAYGLWYVITDPRVTGEAASLSDLALLPLYWTLGVGNALASIAPWRTPERAVFPGLTPMSMVIALTGAVALLAMVVAVWRRRDLRPDIVVIVFLTGCGLYVLATGVTRISFGVSSAMLSRYTYVSTLFLLPFLVAVVSRACVQACRCRAAAFVIGGLSMANVVMWVPVASVWTDWNRTTARIMAAGQDLVLSGASTFGDRSYTPEFSFLGPDELRPLDLRAVGAEIGRPDVLSAVLATQVLFEPDKRPVDGCRPSTGVLVLNLGGEPNVLSVSASTSVDVLLVDQDNIESHHRVMQLHPGTITVKSLIDEPATLRVTTAPGDTALAEC